MSKRSVCWVMLCPPRRSSCLWAIACSIACSISWSWPCNPVASSERRPEGPAHSQPANLDIDQERFEVMWNAFWPCLGRHLVPTISSMGTNDEILSHCVGANMLDAEECSKAGTRLFGRIEHGRSFSTNGALDRMGDRIEGLYICTMFQDIKSMDLDIIRLFHLALNPNTWLHSYILHRAVQQAFYVCLRHYILLPQSAARNRHPNRPAPHHFSRHHLLLSALLVTRLHHSNARNRHQRTWPCRRRKAHSLLEASISHTSTLLFHTNARLSAPNSYTFTHSIHTSSFSPNYTHSSNPAVQNVFHIGQGCRRAQNRVHGHQDSCRR